MKSADLEGRQNLTDGTKNAAHPGWMDAEFVHVRKLVFPWAKKNMVIAAPMVW